MDAEWTKRWLPAAFLLLSLLRPWWIKIAFPFRWPGAPLHLVLFFPWSSNVWVISNVDPWRYIWFMDAQLNHPNLPFFHFLDNPLTHVFVPVLILVGALFGLTSNSRTRSLGGFFGVAGIIGYFIFVFRESPFGTGIEFWPLGFIAAANAQATAIWFLSSGLYLAIAGSLMLLLPRIARACEREPAAFRNIAKECRKLLSVELARRWLPATFLLLSLLLPVWTWIDISLLGTYYYLSFPWSYNAAIFTGARVSSPPFGISISVFLRLPEILVPTLILMSGLCGFSHNNRIRSLGGLIGIAGIISYHAFIFPSYMLIWRSAYSDSVFHAFLPVGLLTASAGSLILLLPLATTIIRRLSSSD